MFTLANYPAWFKGLPLYANMVKAEQATAEAKRSALAAERAVIRATEQKEGPKRQRIVDAARLQSDAARLKAADALAALHRTEAESSAPALAASHRITAIEHELARLAHPCVAGALTTLVDAFEATRRRDGDHRATVVKVEAITAARHDLQALALTADVDTVAAAEAIMARLDMPAV